MNADTGLSVKRTLEPARVSRARFYRFDNEAEGGPNSDMNLPNAIQRIALEWPSYGWRRITALRLDSKSQASLPPDERDRLLCVRKRKFMTTTDANHARKVYPNLAGEMVLTDIDQIWRADITCVRRSSSALLCVAG